MKINKKAFTLAEVLITIGIIGIVAALTLPSLTKLHRDAGTGPILAKTQASIEEAVGRVLLDNPDLILSDTTVANFIPKLSEVLIMTSTNVGDTTWYILKDGTWIKISEGSTGTIPTSAGTGYALVDVDINGAGGDPNPNRAGIDQFQFVLTTYGLMLPVGSKVLGMDPSTCTENTPNLNCTGRMADNNWKIDW